MNVTLWQCVIGGLKRWWFFGLENQGLRWNVPFLRYKSSPSMKLKTFHGEAPQIFVGGHVIKLLQHFPKQHHFSPVNSWRNHMKCGCPRRRKKVHVPTTENIDLKTATLFELLDVIWSLKRSVYTWSMVHHPRTYLLSLFNGIYGALQAKLKDQFSFMKDTQFPVLENSIVLSQFLLCKKLPKKASNRSSKFE